MKYTLVLLSCLLANYSVYSMGSTDLHFKCRQAIESTESCLKFIKKHGVDTLCYGGERTLLSCAAEYTKNLGVIRVLLENKASVNKKDDAGGYTPLYYAVWANQDNDVVQMLLDHKADVSAKTASGRTPLHEAKKGSIVKILLDAKADPRAKNGSGNTPIHTRLAFELDGDEATNETCLYTVKKLVEGKADVTAKNNKGQTATSMAIERRMTGIAQYLYEQEQKALSEHAKSETKKDS